MTTLLSTTLIRNERDNPKLLFCGQLKSPFILQDYDLLKSNFYTDLIDLNIVQDTREGMLRYGWYLITTGISQILKSDIVYIWFADTHALPLVILSKLFNKKCILTIGGWEVANYPEIGYGNQLNYIRGHITNWCIRNSDIVLTPSEAYKTIISDIEPNANIKVVANTIKSELCMIPLPKKYGRVVTALFTLNHDTGILKGIPTFKSAADKLNYVCRVYDAFPHDELMKDFRESKVYCQLSYTESFGITNLEAMACGCVPVVTDRGALPEVIGDSGIIVPYGDVDATVDAINLAMTMDGGVARERAKLYTKDKRLTALKKVIGSLYESPLVSIVIPSYNSSQWLMETIASITVQTYKNIEIIVVDDCSTDNTEELIESFKDDRIVYMRNDVNAGECMSSRMGFAFAHGDYICRLSADDMWVNINKLKRQVKIMRDTNADWSYNSVNCVGDSIFNNKLVESYWMTIPTRYGYRFASLLQMLDNTILSFPRIAFLMMFLRGNPINSSTLMFKATSYKHNEQWSANHRTDCDGLLLYKSLLKGLRGVAIHEMGALYRIHPNQMSYNPAYLKEMKVVRKEVIDEAMKDKYPLWLRLIVECIRRFKYD